MTHFFRGALVLLAVLYLPMLFWADGILYREIFTPEVSLLLSALLKLPFLAIAAWFAMSSGMRLGRDNPAARSWLVLAVGLAAFFLGQCCLAFYQVLRGTNAPYPSIADPFFLLGMVLLIASVARFSFVYIASGLPMGSRRSALITGAGVGLPLILALILVLRPITAAQTSRGEWLLNVTYPILDLILLIPAIVLTRVMVKMRGGTLWLVWARLLAGIVFVALGDVLFAYFTSLKFTALDPLLDLAFAYAYVLLAWGTHTQWRLSQT
jgi:hypothetical protein